jgi:hypothetical protein
MTAMRARGARVGLRAGCGVWGGLSAHRPPLWLSGVLNTHARTNTPAPGLLSLHSARRLRGCCEDVMCQSGGHALPPALPRVNISLQKYTRSP